MITLDNLQKLDEALQTIPISAYDNNYNDWFRISCAYKSGGGSYDKWDSWCAGGSNYNHDENLKTWNSIDEGSYSKTGITEGTLFYYAKPFGYSNNGYSYKKTLNYGNVISDNTHPSGNSPPPKEDDLTINLGPMEDVPLVLTNQESKEDTIKFLHALFEDDEYIGINFKGEPDKKNPDKYSPCDSGVYTKTCKDWIDNIDWLFSNYNKKVGVWCRINPLDSKGCKNENVIKYKYSLVENDDLPLQDQLKLIKALNLPCATVTYSGNKSIHCLVKINATDEEQYKERVKFLYKVCSDNGLKPDESNKAPSKMCRLSGFIRNEKSQQLLATNTGPMNFEEWIDWLDLKKNGLPPIEIFGAEYEKGLPKLSPELIEGVLRQGHKMIVSGDSKSGKSYLMIELALAIANGGMWLGHQCNKGKVLYLNLEIERPSFYHRVERVCEASGLKPTNKNLLVWNLRGFSKSLDELTPTIIKQVKNKNIVAIILDPIYKVMFGDENSAKDIGLFCNQLDKLATELNCAVVYCHHHAKGNSGDKKSIDRMSGSGVFARDSDSIVDILTLAVDDVTYCLHNDDFLRRRTINAYLSLVFRYCGITKDYFEPEDLEEPSAIAKKVRPILLHCLSETELEERLNQMTRLKPYEEKHQCLRISYTLREFPPKQDVDVWFEYPIHYIETSEITSELSTTYTQKQKRDKGLNTMNKETPEERSMTSLQNLRTAFDNLGGNSGNEVFTTDLADLIGITTKTLRKDIDESGGEFYRQRKQGSRKWLVMRKEPIADVEGKNESGDQDE